jgi:HEAT repeat protein
MLMTDRMPALDRWTPAGRRTTDYAVQLLSSTHLPEIEAAEAWLLAHPEEAVPALIGALGTPEAQAAAELLGELDDPVAIEPLVAAHAQGGAGLRRAVEAGLERMSAPAAAAALAGLDRS